MSLGSRTTATVRITKHPAMWLLQDQEKTCGEDPRLRPGFGGRLAVRRYAEDLRKLADS